MAAGTVYGVMFFACHGCGTVRPLRIQLDRSHIGRAMATRCLSCARSGPRGQQQRAADIADDLEWLGLPPEEFARRIGTTVEAVARLFYRVGRHDLARPFERARQAQRKSRKRAA